MKTLWILMLFALPVLPTPPNADAAVRWRRPIIVPIPRPPVPVPVIVVPTDAPPVALSDAVPAAVVAVNTPAVRVQVAATARPVRYSARYTVRSRVARPALFRW